MRLPTCTTADYDIMNHMSGSHATTLSLENTSFTYLMGALPNNMSLTLMLTMAVTDVLKVWYGLV